MHLPLAQRQSINALWNSLYRALKQSDTLQEASQQLAHGCRRAFHESMVLTRVFMTIPYGDLPEFNREFARRLASGLGADGELTGDTPVLSLMGTSGLEPEWEDWRASKAHVGIPLCSPRAMDRLPMVRALFNELGMGVGWMRSAPEGDVQYRTHSGGLFLVSDARAAVDSEHRKIIPDQEFVERYNVATVFGAAARYSDRGDGVVALVCFTNETVPRRTAQLFNPLVYLFRTTTKSLRSAKRFYR